MNVTSVVLHATAVVLSARLGLHVGRICGEGILRRRKKAKAKLAVSKTLKKTVR
jgi:hypothetical protein